MSSLIFRGSLTQDQSCLPAEVLCPCLPHCLWDCDSSCSQGCYWLTVHFHSGIQQSISPSWLVQHLHQKIDFHALQKSVLVVTHHTVLSVDTNMVKILHEWERIWDTSFSVKKSPSTVSSWSSTTMTFPCSGFPSDPDPSAHSEPVTHVTTDTNIISSFLSYPSLNKKAMASVLCMCLLSEPARQVLIPCAQGP